MAALLIQAETGQCCAAAQQLEPALNVSQVPKPEVDALILATKLGHRIYDARDPAVACNRLARS
jgi:ribosomal protein S3